MMRPGIGVPASVVVVVEGGGAELLEVELLEVELLEVELLEVELLEVEVDVSDVEDELEDDVEDEDVDDEEDVEEDEVVDDVVVSEVDVLVEVEVLLVDEVEVVGTEKRCPWMLIDPTSVPALPLLAHAAMKSPPGVLATTGAN